MLENLLFILIDNILPVSFIMAVGFLLERRFRLDLSSLTKLNFYGVTPAFIFWSLYTTEISSGLLKVAGFSLALMVMLLIISLAISKLFHADRAQSSAIISGAVFFNAGNMGLPVIMLCFADSPYLPYAVAVQVVVIVISNVSGLTLGFNIAWYGKGDIHPMDSLKSLLRLPSLHAAILACVFKMIPQDLTMMFFWPALTYLKEMLIGLALISFGIQMEKNKLSVDSPLLVLPVILRLLIGPLTAMLLIRIFAFDPITSQVLLISSAMPTAVTTALIAEEIQSTPRFSSQIVMLTTLLSMFTVTIFITLSSMIYSL